MADLNRLAVLINLAGSIEGLASEMNLDANLIDIAITQGENALTRNAQLELDEKLAHFERTQLDDYQKAELQDYVSAVDDLESVIDDFRNGDIVRNLIANNTITLQDLETAFLFFGNGYTTPNIQNKIIDWLNADNEIPYNKDIFFRMFELDGLHLSDIVDSNFWAWYREVFYND